MKRFFTVNRSKQPQQQAHHGKQPSIHAPTLTPQFTVPPLPHPNPYDNILVLATADGLLLRSSSSNPDSYLTLKWAKEVHLEQVDASPESEVDWESAVSVYGIVGVLQLFTHSYLLLVTARNEVGHHLDLNHTIYSVKSVTPIPLTYERAQSALSVLASGKPPRPPMRPSDTLDTISSSPRVHFTGTTSGATTPAASISDRSSIISDAGTDGEGQEITIPSSHNQDAAAIAKTIAARLSFWNFNKKRASSSEATVPASTERAPLEDLSEEQTPKPTATAHVIPDIIPPSTQDQPTSHPPPVESSTPPEPISPPEPTIDASISPEQSPNANAPATVDERHSELEEKIVRECVKEFSKGAMYFSYTFDITHSLQHKHELLTKDSDASSPLPSPAASDRTAKSVKSPPTSPTKRGTKARTSPSGSPRPEPPHSPKTINSPEHPSTANTEGTNEENSRGTTLLAEPSPTLPLWRRVDRQFWWNESLSRPFVEAGLHNYVLPIMQGYFQIVSFEIPDPQGDPTLTRLPPSRSSSLPTTPGEVGQFSVAEKPSDAGAASDNELAKLGVEQTVKAQLAGPPTSTLASGLSPIEEVHASTEDVRPTISVTYSIVSRRSKYRAGFRYQRRGIDDEARVANFVETETVVSLERESRLNVFSYIQIRGSIPLYWTQISYVLKPPPQLSTDRTHEQNLAALQKHFQRITASYGPTTAVNLAELHGKEAAVTNAYREYVAEAALPDVKHHDYDFHVETKGMKYENISKLINTMERTFDQQGFYWVSGDTLMSKQKGVYRVNCIDCLDRTNVVQSAFAKFVLNKQLSAVALLGPSLESQSAMDAVFNDVWANNGDAISRAYAGTSALKGDYTRTGKRDFSGLLNDGVNSLARMYTATFSDWFSQAVIDFSLGNRSLSVFSEFLLKLQSSDPRDLIRLSKIRAEAIATSVERVLEEGESLRNGWTLFAPAELGTKTGDKWEEKVLLLTHKALYIINYDYTLQKVKLYTRVPLGDIINVTKGAYILSPLEEASRDPKQNAGFVIHFSISRHVTRASSYSIRNSLESPPASPNYRSTFPAAAAFRRTLSRRSILPSAPSVVTATSTDNVTSSSKLSAAPGEVTRLIEEAAAQQAASEEESSVTFAAFKVLPIDPTRMRASASGGSAFSMAEPANDLVGAKDCQEAVDLIVGYLQTACKEIGNVKDDFVTTEDVVSLAEAQKVTSVYAKMEYGVKRLLWLGG